MSIRDILVYVNGNPNGGVRAALALAQQHDAHLTALHVIDIPVSAVDHAGAARIIEIQREAYSAVAQAAQQRTLEIAQKAGVALEWRLDEGRIADRVGSHALTCDLVVAEVTTEQQRGLLDRMDAEDIIVECGKPVLAVPEMYSDDAIGRVATVAWNGTRESSRALSDALPILRKCARVSGVTVDPEDVAYEVGDVPGADVCRFLTRNGVEAEAQTTQSREKSTGEAILAWAKGQGADLIVMGAYGHWRLREWMLGGATRDVLRKTTVPLLMSR
jgi:nucleotide-binding universal stress UspA family protein